jgi:hypothetical protein
MVAKPGGGDGDACHWLTFGYQLVQCIGLLISGDTSISSYPVSYYLCYIVSEGKCCIADWASYFLPWPAVKTCQPGNGSLVVGKNVDVMPVEVVDAYVSLAY